MRNPKMMETLKKCSKNRRNCHADKSKQKIALLPFPDLSCMTEAQQYIELYKKTTVCLLDYKGQPVPLKQLNLMRVNNNNNNNNNLAAESLYRVSMLWLILILSFTVLFKC
jgi:hypothetical protein